MTDIVIAALYHFASVDDPRAARERLLPLALNCGVTGLLILAGEGINGTVAGPRDAIDALLAEIRGWPGFAELEHKEARADATPFLRMKIKIKPEIVTLGEPRARPDHQVGTYVSAQEWDALIDEEDVILIDTRNDYEVAIGTFRGAIDPRTASFREFPRWWREHREEFRGKRVAMFCTGGIRCEKASSFLLSEGVNEVFHLKGGILKYLEERAETGSAWEGSCFVFDERVAVGHGLEPSGHHLCRACRRPVSDADIAHRDYEEGVSCPACIGEKDEARRTRFRERQRQISLAAARGERHVGPSHHRANPAEPA